MGIVVAPYGAEHRSAVEALLGPALAEGSFFRSFWMDLLGGTVPSLDAFLIALDEPKALGLSVVLDRPLVTQSGRSAMYIAAPEHSIAVHRALVPAVDATLRTIGVTDQYITAPAATGQAGYTFDLFGFRPYLDLHSYALPSDLAFAPPPDNVVVRPYDGSAPDWNDQIAILCNRALKSEGIWPPGDGNDVKALIDRPETNWFIAVDEASGSVVAAAEVVPNQSFYNLIAVARSHWGTGLAEHLLHVTFQHMNRLGSPTIYSFVRPTNAASIKMQRRVGGQHVANMVIHAKSVDTPVDP